MFRCNFEQQKIKTTNSLKSLTQKRAASTTLKMNNQNISKSNNDLRLSHMSSSSIEKLDENFCGAFQEHYEYLMDKGLIETCQFSGSQLFPSDYENMSGNVSFKEFLHQYNELKRWLEQMQFSYSDSRSSFCEKYTNQIFYEEILKRSPRRELLNEYACHLVKYHPHLKHDVLSKLNYLNKQWKSIEFSIISKRFHNQDITKDLEEDLKNFEIWLIKVESIVEHLTLNTQWNIDEITIKLSDHKCLQSDIESHARIINSVLKLSTKLKQSCIDCTRFYESGLFLQNRWHCLWLKSLEWQCRLEQELARKRKVSIDLEEIVDNNNKLSNEITRDLIIFSENTNNKGNTNSTSRLNLNKETLQQQIPLLSSYNSPNSFFLIKKQKNKSLSKELEKQQQQFCSTNTTNNNSTESSINNSSNNSSSSSEYLSFNNKNSCNRFKNKKNINLFEQEFNFFKITHSLSSSLSSSSTSASTKSSSFSLNTTTTSSSSNYSSISSDKYNYLRLDNTNRNLQLKTYLNKEIKKYLDDLKIEKSNNSRNSTNTDDGDVIPFDECEYEKILTPHTVSTSETEITTNESIFLVKKQRKIPLKTPLCSKSLSFLTTFKQKQLKQQQMYQEEVKTMSENNLILNNSVESNDSGGCSSGSESATGSDKQQSDNIKVNLNLEEMNRLTLSSDLKHESNEILYNRSIVVAANPTNNSTASSTSFYNRNHRRHRQRRHRKNQRSNSSALYNDLSYYYSLTDVKYYNIDDNDDENIVTSSSVSSLSTSISNSLDSSTSLSLSLSSSKSSSSSNLSMSRVKKFKNNKNQLQKSITLPNANEIASLALLNNRIATNLTTKFSTPQPNQIETSLTGSSSSLSSSSNTSSDNSNAVEKTDKCCVFALKKNGLYQRYNKSFSDYCMSATSSSNRVEQQRRQRVIRFLKNNQTDESTEHKSRKKFKNDYDQNDYEDNIDSDSCLINKKRVKVLKQSSTSILHLMPNQLKKSKCYLCLSDTSNNTNKTTNQTNLNNTDNIVSKRTRNGNEADCDEYDDEYDENSTNELNDEYVEDYNFEIESDNVNHLSNSSCTAIDNCFFKCKLTNTNPSPQITPTTTMTVLATNSSSESNSKTVDQTVLSSNETVLLNQSNAAINSNEQLLNNLLSSVAAIDETSTANTDVSDPHWDGYTSSPYYSTSVTVEDICFNEKTQPILPWDELFFELEPIDDVPLKNNGKKSRSKKNVNLNNLNCSLTHNQFYHHYYHHNQNRYLLSNTEHNQKLIQQFDLKTTKCNKCVCTTNQLTQLQQHQIIQRQNHLASLNYYYLKKLNKNSSANCSTDSSSNNFSGFSLNETSSSSCVSNSHTATQPSPIPNEKFQINNKIKTMEDLINILNDSLSQWDISYNLFVKLKSNQTEHTNENLDFYSLKSSLDLVKYSEILAACQTNINCLASIKNSIIEYKTNRQLKNRELADFDNNQVDFYLPKLDETIIKWKMLESLCIEDNRSLINFNNLIDELKPLKNKIEYISNQSKQTIFFESIDDLKLKLNNLEENCLTLNELLNKINSKKEKYQTFYSLASSFENEQSLTLFTDELTCIEELHKITNISVKVKLNTFEKILKLWLKTEETLNTLKNLKQNLLSEQSLNDFTTELKNFETNLNNFKSDLILSNCFQLNTVIVEVYNLYQIEMDQFKFELSYLTKKNSSKLESSLKMDQKCVDPNCENYKKFNYKSTATTDNDESNEIMTNIHLDFHMNDSIDENNFQMTSTPRYNHHHHIQIENSINQFKQDSLLLTKTYCDKSMATVDDKYSQTDFIDLKTPNKTKSDKRLYQSTDFSTNKLNSKKNLNTHRSLDSGIMCGLDNTSASYGLGSYSSSSPLNYSFANKTNSSELINQEKDLNGIHAHFDASTNTDAPIELISIYKIEEPIIVDEQHLRKRQLNSSLINNKIEEVDTLVTTSESEINFTKTELAILNQDVIETKIAIDDVKNISKKQNEFSFFRLLKYFFLFIFLVCLFVFFILPSLMPSCCDFRKEFLIFNEKNYNYDDTPLPF